ncbi:MAG: hypothetical protein GY926_23135 [bacterium]|nr:hypothetical protein [bacterium]
MNAAGGGHFLDLPPAVAAASHGDTIIIDRSWPTPVSTNKGLTIVSAGGSYPLIGRFVVHDLPAGRRFKMMSFSSAHIFGGSVQLEFLRCKGRIEIAHAGGLRPNGATTEPYMKIEDCADVAIDYSYLYAVSIVRSRVRFTKSDIRGNERGFSIVNAPGILCTDSQVMLSECRVSGPVIRYPRIPRPGIEMTGGELVIAGDDNVFHCVFDHGLSTGWPQSQGVLSPSIQSNGGVVLIDPKIRLFSLAPSLATAGSSKFIFQPTAWTECDLTRVDGTFHPKLRVEAGALCGLFVSAHSSRPLPTPFGNMWLDPASLINLGGGVAQGTTASHGEWTIPAPLPPGLFRQGESFTFQGISLSQGKLEFAVPASGIIVYP